MKNSALRLYTAKIYIKIYMMRSLLTIMLFFTLQTSITINKAYGIEELTYVPAKNFSPSLHVQLDDFLRQNFKSKISDYMITSTDLNGDNVLEYILKRNNCGQYTNICTYLVIAEKEDEITLLSKIDAHKLVIGSGSNYGIKNILAFKNKINAYDFDIYMWSPHKKMYILKRDKKRD